MKSKSSTNRGGARAASKSKTTTDPDEIRQWVESRGGKPACVKGTGSKNDAGLLRIDFPGYSGEETLKPIGWDDFFEKFEEQKLAFVYQDQTSDGQESRFSKLVRRVTSRKRTSHRGPTKGSSKRRSPTAARRGASTASKGRRRQMK